SATVYALFALAILRFVLVWHALRMLLRRLYWHPSRTGYEQLRQRSLPGRSEDQRISLLEPPHSATAVEGALQNARSLLYLANEIINDAAAPQSGIACGLGNFVLALRHAVQHAEFRLSRVLERSPRDHDEDALNRSLALHSAMAHLSALIVEIFEPEWRARANP